MTEIWQPTPDHLAAAAKFIQAGKLVAFPTETVYGLGANALDPEAVRRIFEAKGRPASNPVIVHVAHLDQLSTVGIATEAANHLGAVFWPGPLTLVVQKSPSIPDIVTANGPTVAVRIPNHPVALALIEAAQRPLAAPSANRSEQLSPTSAEHVLLGIGDRIDAILDGGFCGVGVESTVVDATVWPPRILRFGMITAEQIAESLGLSASDIRTGPIETEGRAKSPGQMLRHYAPRTKLVPWIEWEKSETHVSMSAALITTSRDSESIQGFVAVRQLGSDPAEYARLLYSTLHELDTLNLDIVVVDDVPKGSHWSAIRDRLKRASAI